MPTTRIFGFVFGMVHQNSQSGDLVVVALTISTTSIIVLMLIDLVLPIIHLFAYQWMNWMTLSIVNESMHS